MTTVFRAMVGGRRIDKEDLFVRDGESARREGKFKEAECLKIIKKYSFPHR